LVSRHATGLSKNKGMTLEHAMKHRRILAAAMALLFVAVSFHPPTAAVPGNPAWAAEMSGSRSDSPASAGAGTLVDEALQAMDGAEEIVFVVRDLCSAYQWYATFGEYADEPTFIHAPDGSQLCKLNLRTRQVTVLLNDPKGGFRDQRVHYDGGKILFAYRPGTIGRAPFAETGTTSPQRP